MEESKRENKQESTQELLELGASTTKSSKGNIYTLTIIGQIEGHQTLPETVKTTKYEHVIPLLAAVGFLGTGRGAVARPAVREKDAAADRAEPGFWGGALGGQPRLQHRVKGQNGIPEVAAIAPRPAFPQHIALAVQR